MKLVPTARITSQLMFVFAVGLSAPALACDCGKGACAKDGDKMACEQDGKKCACGKEGKECKCGDKAKAKEKKAS